MSDGTDLLHFETSASDGDLTIRMLTIGYDEATLMAPDGVGPSVGQEVYVPMGTDTPSLTIIFANTLYLQPGGTYDFSTHDITIVARRLGMTQETNNAATITVSGIKGADASRTTPPKPDKPSPPPDNDGDGARGADGQMTDTPNGADGNDGSHAGFVTLYINELLAGSMPVFPLILLAAGGPGSDGQPGQDGQDGADGGKGNTVYYNSGWPPSRTEDYHDGGDGGTGADGGDGGKPGNGGNGGAIEFHAWARTGSNIPDSWQMCVKTVAEPGAPGNPGLGGKKGHGGAGGWGEANMGNSGADGAKDGTPGPAGKWGDASPTVDLEVGQDAPHMEDFASHVLPDQIAATLAQMRFFYLTNLSLNSFQRYSDDKSVDDAIASFKSSLDYVIALRQSSEVDWSADEWKPVRLQVDDLALKVQNKLDFYGNRFSMVPTLNPDVSFLEKEIAALSQIEQWFVALQDAVRAYDTKKDDVAQTFADITKQSADDQKTLDDEAAAIVRVRQDLEPAQTLVYQKMEILDDQFTDSLNKVTAGMSWNSQGFMAAIGSSLQFAGPEFNLETEASQRFAAGSVLSAGSNFDASKVDIDGTPVDKSLIISQTQNIEDGLDGLHAAWTSTNGVGLLNANGNSVLFATERAETEKFIKQYFDDDSDLKAALNDYLDAVQAQNTLVLEYNDHLMALLKAQADQIQLQQAKAQLLAGLDQLNAPDLIQVLRLASSTHQQQLQKVFQYLYEAGRAYNCLALDESASMEKLAGLGSFDSVTSDALQAALDTLREELQTYHDGLATNRSESVTITLTTTNANFVDAFKRNRAVTVLLDPDLPAGFDGETELADKYDTRVTQVRAYLLGAVGSVGQSITVNVISSGRGKVVPYWDRTIRHSFDLPEVISSNVYSRDTSGTFVDQSTEDVASAEMRWGGDVGTQSMSVPLLPVYTAWKVELPPADDSTVLDLTNLTGIRLDFDIAFRGSPALRDPLNAVEHVS